MGAPGGQMHGPAPQRDGAAAPQRVEACDGPVDSILRGLIEAAPDALLAVDHTGRIVFANARAVELFGYESEELLGKAVEMLVPEGARRLHPGHREGYLADPRTRPMGAAGMQLAGRRKDGSEFPAEISLSAFTTDGGPIVAAAIRDATLRQRAEAQFRGLLEAAPDAVVIVEEDGRIALANAQAERLFGYPREELVGGNVDMLIPESARGLHPGHRAAYFRDPRTRPMGAGMQLAARRRDGTEFPAEISLSHFESEDGLLVSAAVRDVTERIEAQIERERLRNEAERERLERRLQQSQRLESLGLLAGGVAHDFNNLLAVILVYAAMVEEEVARAARDAGGDRWGAVTRDVGQIKLAAERATRLTHQLLAFGRREVVQPRPLDLNDVVRDVETLLRRTLGEQVDLVTTPAHDLAAVIADPGQVEQVLVNLAVNARDAMPGGGTLTIGTENVVIDEAYIAAHPDVPPGAYVHLRVSDSGTGMPRDVVEHAFEPFFTTKPKGEGSGLGLSTVYGIVTQANGFVHIYSEPGVGTSISVLLPAADAPVEPAAADAAPAQRRSGDETILVVEDEPAMREVARRILSRNGYKVLVAGGGHEALGMAEQHEGRIDLLVTDVVMPRMLGKEVAERLTRVRPETRVLYMSGYAHPVLASQGTLEPGVTLLEKPFSEDVMLAKVRAALDSAPPGRDAADQELRGSARRPGAGRPIRVLVIDDQDIVATTFRRLLEIAGMDVVAVAASLEQGLAAVEEHDPDVIVVDYLLPDGLGTDAVTRILGRNPAACVVMASGSDTAEGRLAALAAGCVAYVDKASAVRTLVPAVRDAAANLPPRPERPGVPRSPVRS